MPYPRGSQYEDLLELHDRIPRVLPPVPPLRIVPDREFCPASDMLIEAPPLEVRQLALEPAQYRLTDDQIQNLARGKHTNRRQRAQKATQHSSRWADQLEACAAMPDGVRLWHADERVRGILVHAKHDLRELFEWHDSDPESIPYRETSGAKTLFITPNGVLGFREVLSLITPQCQYLTRACTEYARMACWMYGLRMEEFTMLTQASITRHALDETGTLITLLQGGGGYHNSGPLLKVHIGTQWMAHDMSPSLMTPYSASPGPVRITVGEGVLMTLDGYARANYAHGYAHNEAVCFYTLDFSMDCMRSTLLLSQNRETLGLVMHSPVIAKHVVQAARDSGVPQHAPPVENSSVVWKLIHTMRGRLQDAESNLLASKCTQARATTQHKQTSA